MQAPAPIGILGGMGPEATILLQQKLVEAVPARDDADHIPLLIDMNPQVPARIAHLIDGTGTDPGPTLATMARRLEQAGARALAMPCNTAHHYTAAITDAVTIPFLSMIDLAATHALAAVGRGGTIGLLASPATRHIRLFETAMEAHNISVLWPEDDPAMLTAIRAIKAGDTGAAPRTALRHASDALATKGSALQLVACSEFSMIADAISPTAKSVDTLDLLVAAMVGFAPTA